MLNLLPYDGKMEYYPDFLSPEESEQLFSIFKDGLEWHQPEVFVFGKWYKTPRLVAYYGEPHAYSYSGQTHEALPFTPELNTLLNRLEDFTQSKFTNVLLNYYRSGEDGMGWHSDDEKELGENPTIASVSLGATRKFSWKHKKEKERGNLSLESGSLLLMKGAMQHHWQHALPKTKTVIQGRINLTFRQLVSH